MKKFSKLLALLLAALLAFSMSLNAFAAAEETEEEDVATEEEAEEGEEGEDDEDVKTLVYVTSTFGQKFSPFFYTTAYDAEVVDMFTAYTGAADRGGAVLNEASEGVVVEYNGTEYSYESMSDLEVIQNDDDTTDYVITMRDDIVFSDGTPATIDDVIFSLYVCCDPTYDGSSTMYALPIEGMEEYRSGMENLLDMLVAAGPENEDFEYWDEETQTAFWASIEAAGEKFAQEIVDYVVANYAEDYAEDYVGATAEEVMEDEGLQVELGMMMWGFGDYWEEGATAADYWAAIVDAYEGDIVLASDTESANSSIFDLMEDKDDYVVGVNTGEGASSISGIIKNDDYSMTIHTTEFDATAIYSIGSLICAPLHWYGDPELYDYENESFGFVKGDLSSVKAKTTDPLGAGPFVYEGYDKGVVTMSANEYYFKGAPKFDTLLMVEGTDSDYVPGIVSGSFDVASPSINESTLNAIKDANENGEIVGDVVTTYLVDYRGYGYIGCSAALVNVDDEPGSFESKCLRKGFMTLLSVYRDAVISSYYGDRASVIQYPISNTSWAAPKPADEGFANAYSKDVNGEDIYTDDMTEEEKYAAAYDAAVEYFKAAGLEYDEATGKFNCEETYEIMIPGQGEQDHPAYGVADAASQALAEMGIKLQVNDVQTATWNNALEGNTAMMWAAAWQSSVDPDMTQVYSSGNYITGTNSNHYAIQDEELDELIAEGRASADTEERKSIYKAAMEIIMDWGVELPTYQRKDCYTVSTERVNTETVPGDMTPYWGVFAEIHDLEVAD